METPDEKWFRERLRHFLEIRHPPRQFHHVMIERRSRLAFESYAQSVELGVPAASAVRAADKVLFRGLLFSKYDTVHLILATDFPIIPENQRQEIALRLVRICAPIFRAYDLKDDFFGTSGIPAAQGRTPHWHPHMDRRERRSRLPQPGAQGKAACPILRTTPISKTQQA